MMCDALLSAWLWIPRNAYHDLVMGRDGFKVHSIADKTEYVKQIKALLGSKDFRERIRGIDQLVADCQENPYMVICNMFPVTPSNQIDFYVFKLSAPLGHSRARGLEVNKTTRPPYEESSIADQLQNVLMMSSFRIYLFNL